MTRPATVTTCPCPSCGAESGQPDYCTRCGAILQAPDDPPAAEGPRPCALICPSCTATRAPGDAFCEVCGLDFESGELPVPPPEAAEVDVTGGVAEWTVVIEADRAFFDTNQVEVTGGLAFPHDLPPREVALPRGEVVVGRRGQAGGACPAVDLSGDPAVSRRHAILRQDPDGALTLIDLGSANGTWVNGATAAAPPGALIALDDGDRVRLGAFTVLRTRRTLGGG